MLEDIEKLLTEKATKPTKELVAARHSAHPHIRLSLQAGHLGEGVVFAKCVLGESLCLVCVEQHPPQAFLLFGHRTAVLQAGVSVIGHAGELGRVGIAGLCSLRVSQQAGPVDRPLAAGSNALHLGTVCPLIADKGPVSGSTGLGPPQRFSAR
jgi:hypothetical protein